MSLQHVGVSVLFVTCVFLAAFTISASLARSSGWVFGVKSLARPFSFPFFFFHSYLITLVNIFKPFKSVDVRFRRVCLP
jgi:hypothetical protein